MAPHSFAQPLQANPLFDAACGAGTTNPLFEQEEGDDEADDFDMISSSQENDSFIGNGWSTVNTAIDGNQGPFAEIAAPPQAGSGGLLASFRRGLLASPVLCAVTRLHQCGLHPLGRGLDTVDFTLAGIYTTVNLLRLSAARLVQQGQHPPAQQLWLGLLRSSGCAPQLLLGINVGATAPCTASACAYAPVVQACWCCAAGPSWGMRSWHPRCC